MSADSKASSVIKPIYVISGKDDYLLSTATESLLDRLLSPDQRPMALYQPSADSADIADVLDELRTVPFLADRRVVLIRQAGSFISSNRDALEKYFESPSATGVLVLTVDSFPSATRLAKKLPSVGEHIDTGNLKPYQLPNFIADHLSRKYDKSISNSNARLLVELVGDDPGKLVGEAEKLAIYIGSKKAVNAQDIEQLIGHNRMFDAFAVIDSVTSGDTAGAIKRLRNMFASDSSAEYTVVGAFAYHFRKLFTAKSLLQKGLRRDQVLKQAKVWSNSDAFFRQLEGLSLNLVASMLCRLAEIDFRSKTSSVSTKDAIERLIIDFTV